VLPLRYKFDPSANDDGVTITIPHAVLTQINEAALSWLIPSLLADKVEALLKGLPKAIRRQLVPVPDTVKRLMSDLPHHDDNKSLTQVLNQLLQPRGLRISHEDWQESENNLPLYCKFNIEVVDNKGKVLATGRDLATLKIQFSSQQVALAVLPSNQLLTEFPAEIAPIVEKKVAGLPTRSYAALVLQEQGVTLQYLPSQSLAQQEHQRGTMALLQKVCASEVKLLKKIITPALAVDFSPYGNKAQLELQFVQAVFNRLFGAVTIYTLPDFNELLQQKRGLLLSEGQQVLKLASEIFKAWREVNKQLGNFKQSIFAQSIADINQQLVEFKPSQFLAELEPKRWQEYPRYLKALQVRLERLPNNLNRDVLACADIQKCWQQYQQKRIDYQARSINIQPLDDYRWLLEEYRTSLFSQPMKTAVPISNERLNKLWQQLT
jgi:ATP-dependent helicase HrpA